MSDAAPHLDDERLSALVDGLDEPEDAVHAADCPDCGARLAAWQAVAARVAAVPPLPDEAKVDQAIAAALGAGVTGSVTDISEARRRRTLRAPAAVAAAVLVVVGLSVGLAQIGSGTHHPSNSATAGGAAPSAASGGGISSHKAAVEGGNLGTFENTAALIPALQRLVGSRMATNGGTSAPAAQAPPSNCTAQAQQELATTTSNPYPQAEAALTFRGVPSYVAVFTSAGRRTAVITSTACTLETQFTFP